MTPEQDCAAVMDFFTIDGSWLSQSPYLTAYCVDRLEALRRAVGFTAKIGIAPLATQVPIATNDTAFFQIRVARGTVIWGFSIYSDNDFGYALQISETGGRSLYAEPIQLTLGTDANLDPVYGSPALCYMVEPFTVAATGEINVQLSNLGLVAEDPIFPFQLAILMAEPNGVEEHDADD